MINIIIQSVRQGETGIAMAMNTLFRTARGVSGPPIASAFLAATISPLKIRTYEVTLSPFLPNATAFSYIFLTTPGLSLAEVLETLLVTSERRR